MECRTTRRMFGTLSVLALGVAGCAADSRDSIVSEREAADIGASSDALHRRPKRIADDVLLVHGAWADGSCWSKVIAVLQQDGFTVRAVQLREQSLEDDAALVRHAIDSFPGPLVVAGHSYGGFVMSEASAGAANITALVFVAAFAPDQGESLGLLTKDFPTPTLMNLLVDDQGNTTIEPDAFVEHFASDIPERDARILAAVQHPTAYNILLAEADEPGWKTIPSYYQVSLDDEVIHPELQRSFAARMGAHTVELRASHVSIISRARTVAALINRAAHAP